MIDTATLQRQLIVLDLDETLIFATETPTERTAEFRAGRYHVYRRPYLAPFLDFCFARFTVGVWTTASPTFAARVVEQCFPNHDALQFVWASDRCTRAYNAETTAWEWRKPLVKLTRRGWSREAVIAVDDTPSKWAKSHGNLVAVRPWFGDTADDELARLMPYLTYLQTVPNVRTIEKRGWQRRTGEDNGF